MKIVNNFRFLQFLTQGYEIYKKKLHKRIIKLFKKNGKKIFLKTVQSMMVMIGFMDGMFF